MLAAGRARAGRHASDAPSSTRRSARRAACPAGPPGDGDGDWDLRLAAWARAQLALGHDGLHAQARERFDRALLEAALEHTGGRRTEAAARLGLGRNTLTRKLGPGRKRPVTRRFTAGLHHRRASVRGLAAPWRRAQ